MEFIGREKERNILKNAYSTNNYEGIVIYGRRRIDKKGKMKPPLYKVGKYYYDDPINKTNGEFDVVTFNKNGYDFYEVKFSSSPIDDSIVKEEIYQLSKINIKYNKLGFISKSGFNLINSKDYILYSLDDIYSE